VNEDGLGNGTGEGEYSSAEYVFHLRFHLAPQADVRLDPQTFETILSRPADQPGTDGWLFFRDHLWRGEVNDEQYLRELAEAILGIPVETIAFRELRTDPSHFDSLKEAIERELDTQRTFGNAASVDEVLKNYFGSSIHVRPPNQ
jgi:hypothetical protein